MDGSCFYGQFIATQDGIFEDGRAVKFDSLGNLAYGVFKNGLLKKGVVISFDGEKIVSGKFNSSRICSQTSKKVYEKINFGSEKARILQREKIQQDGDILSDSSDSEETEEYKLTKKINNSYSESSNTTYKN